jgi:hypothetical protein
MSATQHLENFLQLLTVDVASDYRICAVRQYLRFLLP